MDNLTTSVQIDPAVEVYYDRVLLENAKPRLVHDRFAQKRPLPRGQSKVIKFRRYAKLSTATAQLTEGVTPPGKQLSKSDIRATAAQYGDFIHVTDVVELTDGDQALNEGGDILGTQMGETHDEIVRNSLLTCTSTTTAASGTPTATALNKTDIDAVVKTLLNADARMVTALVHATDGVGTTPVRPAFWGITNTNLIDDLEAVSGFLHTSKYPAQGSVDESEWGQTGNVRWLTSSVAHGPSAVGDAYAAGTYYWLPIIGQNAYGITELSGGNAKMIIKALGSAGAADPLNQRQTMGWKDFFVARVLNDNFMHLLKVTHS